VAYPSGRIQIHNRCEWPRTVLVEPWALPYTIPPGGELTIVAVGSSPAVPWFGLVEWEDTTQVYCEDATDFVVEPAGLELVAAS